MKINTLLVLLIAGIVVYGVNHGNDFGLSAIRGSAAPETPPPARIAAATPTPRPIPMPAMLKKLIEEGGDAQAAKTAFAKYLNTAPQLEVHGTVRRHLRDGHTFATGWFTDVATRGSAHTQEFVVFGLPFVEELADGDIFDCYAVMGEPMELPDGSMVRELIHIEAGGRIPPRFERSTYK